jgi:ankyrin repeat protein
VTDDSVAPPFCYDVDNLRWMAKSGGSMRYPHNQIPMTQRDINKLKPVEPKDYSQIWWFCQLNDLRGFYRAILTNDIISPMALFEADNDALKDAVTEFQDRATEGTFYDADYRNGDLIDTTGLMMAVQTGVTSLVQVFRSLGADVNDHDNEGHTALHLAVHVICLASQNAHRGNYDDYDLPFKYYAITTRHINMLEYLIMNDEDVNAVNIGGYTPLMLACGAGRISIHSVLGGVNVIRLTVDQLIKASADINLADNNGFTALHHACKRADVQTVISLLSQPDIDVHAKDSRDRTPLDTACDVRSLRKNFWAVARVNMKHEAMTQRVRVVEYLLDACGPMEKTDMKISAMAIATRTHPSTYTDVGSNEREFLVPLQQTLIDILRLTKREAEICFGTDWDECND